MTINSTPSQTIVPASFGPDTRIPPEQIAEFHATLLMLVLMVIIFLFIKRYWVAWLVATVTSSFAGIIVLAPHDNPLGFYFILFVPGIIIGAGIASAIIGLIMYLSRLYRESKKN